MKHTQQETEKYLFHNEQKFVETILKSIIRSLYKKEVFKDTGTTTWTLVL